MKSFQIVLALCCILFGIQYPQAQKLMIFNDDFENNVHSWLVGAQPAYIAVIQDGSYDIQHFRTSGYWSFWQYIPIHDHDFAIECEFEKEIKDKNGLVGLIWGLKDNNNFHVLLIDSTGRSAVQSVENGLTKTIADWSDSIALNQNKKIKLLLKRKANMLEIYINDIPVHKIEQLPFRGNHVGFLLAGQTFAHIDYLRVFQDRAIRWNRDTSEITKINLGPSINSPYNELAPIVSSDGRQLHIVRKYHPLNTGEQKNDDIWFSERTAEGKWAPIQQLPEPINNSAHNQCIGISEDMQFIFLGSEYEVQSSNSKGISISKKDELGYWQKPQKITVENFYNFNALQSYYLSTDRKILLMSVERSGGLGQLDLYVSFQKKERHYTAPLNLGSLINTGFNEATPFLAADQKTLYFASEGLPGYGSMDIFMSKRLDDSWLKWSDPINLGPKVNTLNWEADFSISADGKNAFMVSNHGPNHQGSDDIYRIRLPKVLQPDSTFLVSGNILDAISKRPLRADIDFEIEKKWQQTSSDNIDGSFQLLSINKAWARLIIKHNDYFPLDTLLNTHSFDVNSPHELHLYPLKNKVILPLNCDSISKKNMSEAINRVLELRPDLRFELHVKDSLSWEKVFTDSQTQINLIQSDDNCFLQFFTDRDSQFQDLTLRDTLDPLINGQRYVLSGTTFQADSSKLTDHAIEILGPLSQIILEQTNVKLEVIGHTNGLPSHAYCDRLSLERARSVKAFFVEKGINPNRIITIGMGKRNPIASNENEVGRAKNQRVEFVIIDQ